MACTTGLTPFGCFRSGGVGGGGGGGGGIPSLGVVTMLIFWAVACCSVVCCSVVCCSVACFGAVCCDIVCCGGGGGGASSFASDVEVLGGVTSSAFRGIKTAEDTKFPYPFFPVAVVGPASKQQQQKRTHWITENNQNMSINIICFYFEDMNLRSVYTVHWPCSIVQNNNLQSIFM